MEQAQLIAVVNTQWNYFLLTDFIPESRIPIVDNFLILFVTLLYGFPMSICVNSTTSLQKIKIHQNDFLKTSSPSTLLLKSKVFSFMYAQFIPSLYFTYNPPLTFINSKIPPSAFGKVEAINLLAFMLSSYSSYISFLNHCQTVDSETSLHSVFSSALREPGPLIYLLFALTSMHFIALSECKTRVYEVQLAFGIIEQDITKLMH